MDAGNGRLAYQRHHDSGYGWYPATTATAIYQRSRRSWYADGWYYRELEDAQYLEQRQKQRSVLCSLFHSRTAIFSSLICSVSRLLTASRSPQTLCSVFIVLYPLSFAKFYWVAKFLTNSQPSRDISEAARFSRQNCHDERRSKR
jgi:hypothetical protein